jgi:hypothetical protein
MAATHSLNSTGSVAPVLYVSFELSSNQWKLASITARGQQPRLVSVPAGDRAVSTRNANGIRATEVAATSRGRRLLRVKARDAPEYKRAMEPRTALRRERRGIERTCPRDITSWCRGSMTRS